MEGLVRLERSKRRRLGIGNVKARGETRNDAIGARSVTISIHALLPEEMKNARRRREMNMVAMYVSEVCMWLHNCNTESTCQYAARGTQEWIVPK